MRNGLLKDESLLNVSLWNGNTYQGKVFQATTEWMFLILESTGAKIRIRKTDISNVRKATPSYMKDKNGNEIFTGTIMTGLYNFGNADGVVIKKGKCFFVKDSDNDDLMLEQVIKNGGTVKK